MVMLMAMACGGPAVTIESVVEALSAGSSTWHRMDVLRAVCDRVRPVAGVDGERWAAMLDRAAERVLEHCVDKVRMDLEH